MDNCTIKQAYWGSFLTKVGYEIPCISCPGLPNSLEMRKERIRQTQFPQEEIQKGELKDKYVQALAENEIWKSTTLKLLGLCWIIGIGVGVYHLYQAVNFQAYFSTGERGALIGRALCEILHLSTVLFFIDYIATMIIGAMSLATWLGSSTFSKASAT